MERCVCLLGLPGSGKSTLARALADAGLGTQVAAGDWLRDRASVGDVGALRLLETATTMDRLTFERFLSDVTRYALDEETLVLDGAPRTAAQVGWMASFGDLACLGRVRGIYLQCRPDLATLRIRARGSRYGDGAGVASTRVDNENVEISTMLKAFSKLWEINELNAASSTAELVAASLEFLLTDARERV